MQLLHEELVHAAERGITTTSLGPWVDSVERGWEALLASLHPVFGMGKYPDLASKAARIIHGGSTTQYLMDGNKRLATAAMLAQLHINGQRLDVGQGDLVAFVLTVSTSGSSDHEEKVARAAEWIEARLVPIDR